MNDPVLSIDIMNAESASKRTTGSVEDKLRAAMVAVLFNTMARYGRDAALLNASVAGVISDIGQDSEDGQRLVLETRSLNQLNAMLAASASGLSVGVPDLELPEDFKPIGILKIWQEVAM